MSDRLPAHLEAGALMRLAEARGGFGMVLHKGERDAGTILIVTVETSGKTRLWDRMPNAKGEREWTELATQATENAMELNGFLTRRQRQDPDLWVIELTVADGERFVRELSHSA